ncbi:MAG: S9 family peptidase [Prevotellaceae bacterium]|jgi:dipeptidyl-peptidase-4|nr:S9 family peptidase [Prevotellaceae bacterium]
MKTIRFLIFGLFLFSGVSLAAQKKQLTGEELRNNSVRITAPVLQVKEWRGRQVTLTCVASPVWDSRTVVVDAAEGKIVSDSKGLEEQAGALSGQEQFIASIEDAVNPVLSPDSAYVAFTRRHDLYTIRLADRKETRLTFDGGNGILNGYASWVYMEEILGRAGRYRAFWWSPDSRRLAFFRSDDRRVPLFTITDSPGKNGYVETMRYPKAGDTLPQVKAGIVSPDGGEITWAAIDSGTEHYLGLPYWRPDGQALWLQWLNRDQNHYKLLEITAASGAAKELYEERQNTWISLDDEPRIRFLPSGKGFILASDKSGWRQLYLHNMNGRLLHRITAGSYTVTEILAVDEKAKTVYFTGYKDQSGALDFYKVGLDGKRLQRLSFGGYSHRIALSPDNRYFITTYSNVEMPPQVALYRTDGKFICAIQDTKNENFDLYARPETRFLTLRSDDGRFIIPLRITYPLRMEAGKTYPVKLNVYGGPGVMQVRNEWSDAFGNNAYQYARDGLLQVTLDHRGSGHNGKTGEEEMFRRLGYWEITDYSQAVRWLAENAQADTTKVMITGFSYGGYITCYALTYGAGVFTHGVAGGSVTDWQLYDAIYTERYMDTPADNPEGYAAASALTHAAKLKGKLLLTHGLRDENVHAQNTFQLISVLENLNKDFELMLYPESRHGYRGAKNEHSRHREREFIYTYLLEK